MATSRIGIRMKRLGMDGDYTFSKISPVSFNLSSGPSRFV
jgi:hypothetical protein